MLALLNATEGAIRWPIRRAEITASVRCGRGRTRCQSGRRSRRRGRRKVRQIAAVLHDERQFAGGQTRRNQLNAAHVDAATAAGRHVAVSKGSRRQRTGRTVAERHRSRHGLLVQTARTVAQVADQALLDARLNVLHLADVAAHLLRAVGKAGLELVQHAGRCVAVRAGVRRLLVVVLLVLRVLMVMVMVAAVLVEAAVLVGALDVLQMFDRHLQNVGLFEFRVSGGLKAEKRVCVWRLVERGHNAR